MKGGSTMNCNVTIDWKFIAALGGTVVGITLVKKLDAESAEKVLIHCIDTFS